MSDPKSEWKAILNARTTSAQTTPLEQPVHNFVETLDSESYIHAELVQSGSFVPSYSVAISPKNRPHERSLMINYLLRGDAIEFRDGGDKYRAESTDDVVHYLTDFLRSPGFQNTLRILEARSAEPHQAILRTIDATTLASQDVLLRLSAENRQKLVAAFEGDGTEYPIQTHPEQGAPLGSYDPGQHYECLDSEGLVLEVVRHEKSDEGILVWVRKAADTDPAGGFFGG